MKTLPINDLDSVKRAYRGLDLQIGQQICDDQEAIDKKVAAMKVSVHRMSASPSSTDQAFAAQWQRDVAEITTEDKRTRILETIVYPSFKRRAKTSTDAAIEQQNNPILTVDLAKRFTEDVREDCYVRADLAWLWFQRFCREEGIEIGKPLGPPKAIEDFSANSGPDKITLSWRLPSENCDEVEIVREMDGEPTGKRAKAKKASSRKVSGTSYDDDEAAAGVWHTYRAFSWFKGQRDDSPQIRRAIRWIDVSNVQCKPTVAQVDLAWELPPHVVGSVKIFKRKDGSPKLRKGTLGWEPDDGETRSYDGGHESWRDTQVEEGGRYFYRVVVDFGSGVVTDGVEISVEVPKRPGNVPKLTAEYKPEQGKDQVLLSWQPVQAGSSMKYVVMRRDGKIPPLGADDGKALGPFAETGHVDTDVVPGQYYTYAVFACIDELYSHCGATAPAVAILSDVRELRENEGDGTVELHWLTPPNVVDVIVRRDLTPPPDHRAGQAVDVVNKQAGKPGLAKDSGLENEKTYYYLARCEYKLGASEVRFSEGISVKAKPVTAPDPVKDFKVEVKGRAVQCVWTPPLHGQVLVRRHSQPVDYPAEALVDTEQVLRLGSPLVTSSGKAEDDQPDVSEPYYSIFTVAGSRAVFGGSRTAIVCPDVTDLRLTAVQEGVRLEWVWPTDCTAVRIVRRLGDWPQGPNDPGAVLLTRLEYQNAGNHFLDRIQQRGGHFHYIVYTQVSGGREILFSPGTSPGCRATIEFGRSMTLSYRLTPGVFWKLWSRETLLEWDVEEPLAELAGFVLVANQQHPPANFTDGIEILRWKPAVEDAGKKRLQRIPLEQIRKQGWARFFCRAFTADPEQSRLVFIVHPDVCISWSSTGRSPMAAKRKPPGYYRPGVPKTVICPKCFEEFPLSKMKFADSNGNKVTGRYRLLDRVLRQPLRPPQDAHGGNYTVKLCPNEHQLPFNAGTQNSLVIGVIGARSSGKSHYIASLIDRLQGPVGDDMQAGLMSVTDETPDRYRREFYEPLLVRHLQLPVTPRLPPPLIYELSIDGALWGQKRGRSVTLALYDTAGEDLNDPEVVRKMLLYIPVASGILLLADPLQMPGVRQLLPASSLPPLLKDADPHPILDRVLPELEQRRRAMHAGKVGVPLAVVLTKCDALRDAGLIAQDRVWHTNMRHIGYFSRQIHCDMHGMMGEYVQRWSNHVYTTVTSHFARHAFFGVSATGCAPDPSTQRFRHVSPWRVEDPLLWLLAELGVIPSR